MEKTGAEIQIERMMSALGFKRQNQLAKALGVDPSAIAHYKSKDSVPLVWLDKILHSDLKDSNVIIEILQERASMEADAGEPTDGVIGMPFRLPSPVQVPLVSGKLSGKGAFQALREKNPLWLSTDYLGNVSSSDVTSLLMLHVHGRHMEPEIMDGDFVIVDGADTFPDQQAIMAVTIEGCLGVYRIGVSPGEVIFYGADRARYPDIRVPRELLNSPQATIEGRVVSVFRTYRKR